MSRENNPLTVYLTDEEKRQLEEWSEETGKSLSDLGRDAITEYTDYDRLQRIEDKVDTLLSLVEESEHTRTSNLQQRKPDSVPEKARAIAQRLHTNHETPIKGVDVEIAIEDIAGGDDRTVEKYKEQLKKRQLLFRHPFQPVWTPEKSTWVKWVEQSQVADQSHELAEEYNIDLDDYEEIAAGVVE